MIRTGEKGIGRNVIIVVVGATLILLALIIRIEFSREITEIMKMF